MRGARGVAPASARAAATRPQRAACHKASPDTQQLITTRRSVWGRAGRANAHAARCCTHTRARPSHDAVVRCWRRVPALAPPVVPRHAPVGAPPHPLYFPFTWAPPTPRVVRRPPVHVARTLPRGLALPHLPLRAGLLGSYERGIVLRSPAQVAVLADVFSGPADLRLPVYGVADGETNVARRGCADGWKRASDRELWPHRRCVQLRRPRDPRLLDALTPGPAGGEYRANDRGGGRRGGDAMTRGPPAPLAARGDPPTRFAGTERPSRAAPRRAPRGACRVAPRRARAQFAARGGGRPGRRSPPPLPCSVAPTRCSSSAARALRRRLGRSPGGEDGGRGGRQGHDVLHAAVQARRGGGGAAAAPARWRARARQTSLCTARDRGNPRGTVRAPRTRSIASRCLPRRRRGDLRDRTRQPTCSGGTSPPAGPSNGGKETHGGTPCTLLAQTRRRPVPSERPTASARQFARGTRKSSMPTCWSE